MNTEKKEYSKEEKRLLLVVGHLLQSRKAWKWAALTFLFNEWETMYFIKREGYHVFPTTTAEIICDYISATMGMVAIFYMGSAWMVKKSLKSDDK